MVSLHSGMRHPVPYGLLGVCPLGSRPVVEHTATIAGVQAMTIPSRIVLAPFVFLRHSRYAHGHFENAAKSEALS